MIDKEKIEGASAQFRTCAPFFIALGDPHRQKLCLALAEAGEEGINVADLTGKSILSRPAVSHHLKVLKDCGLVEPLKKGTQIFYRLRLKNCFESFKQLMQGVEKILEEVGEED